MTVESAPELLAGGHRDRHAVFGSVLLAAGVALAVEGCLSTWWRVGELFPGEHIFAGAATAVAWVRARVACLNPDADAFRRLPHRCPLRTFSVAVCLVTRRAIRFAAAGKCFRSKSQYRRRTANAGSLGAILCTSGGGGGTDTGCLEGTRFPAHARCGIRFQLVSTRSGALRRRRPSSQQKNTFIGTISLVIGVINLALS